MGGGGPTDTTTTTATEEANPAFTGQMRTFGAGMPTAVQNQLNMGGLGGLLDPSQFQQTTMPILTNPGDLKLYLQSLGITPTEVGATSTTSSTGDYPSYAEPHNIPEG